MIARFIAWIKSIFAVAPENRLPEPSLGYFLNKKGERLISFDGMDMCKHFEGCSLVAYYDGAKSPAYPQGRPTIGWGRIKYDDGRDVSITDTCTQEEAAKWLLEDLETDGAHFVRAWIKVPLNDAQWSALVDFTYNRGAGRFNEKLVGIINSGDFLKAEETLLEYNYAGDPPRVMSGLARRRSAEREMFQGGDWKKFKA